MTGSLCAARQGQSLPDYPDYVERLRQECPNLAQEIAGFPGIEQVLQWMQQRDLLRARVDSVGQDEFNYDFLIELEPAGRWLCFGVT